VRRRSPCRTPPATPARRSGNAGTAIALDVASALTATDGTESLSIKVTGVPSVASLSAGTKNADGSWTLTPTQLSGLTLMAPAGSYAGTANLTIAATATETDGSVATTVASMVVAIAGVATAPTLSVQPTSGNAGTAIALSIASGLTATDGTETLAIRITGVPSAATLSAGTKNADGSWTLMPSQLSGLTLTAPAGSFAGTANLTVTATATETDGSSAVTSAALPVAIAGVATTPTLTVQNASGNAGTAIALGIGSALTATDGTESLTIRITGVPGVASLSAGTKNADGSWTLTAAQLAGLTLTAPAGSFAGTATLGVTATATETDGSTAATSSSLALTIAGVASTPTLLVQPASGNPGGIIPLSIASALTATDGTETLSVTISGLPSGATLSAGTRNADGSWTLTTAQLLGLSLNAPSGSSGNFNLTVTATAQETDGSMASVAATLALLVSNPGQILSTAGTGVVLKDQAATNDTLISTGAGNTLIAGSGADTLVASGTGDTLIGGSGTDTFVSNANGNTLVAGTGTAIAQYSANNVVVVHNARTAAETATLSGASAHDALVGFHVFVASGSHDTLTGALGDTLIALGSQDTLTASGATSTIVSNGNGNYLSGLAARLAIAADNATINLATRTAGVNGATPHDTLAGTFLVVQAYGVNDTLIGGAAASTLIGNLANTTLIAGTGATEAAYAGAGVVIDLGAGTARANGGASFDTLVGITNAGAMGSGDTLIGGAALSTFTSSAAGNTLIAGSGGAMAAYAGSNVTVDLRANQASVNGANVHDVLIGITEATVGSDDTLIGGGGADILISEGTGNTLIAGSGRNTLLGDYGDTLVGNGNGSTLIGQLLGDPATQAFYAGSGMIVDLSAGIAGANGGATQDTLIGITYAALAGSNSTLLGGNVSDTLVAAGSNETLIGGTAQTTLVGNGIGNTLIAGAGGAVAYYSANGVAVDMRGGTAKASGSSLADTLLGVSAAIASGSNDTLIGGNGSSTLLALGSTDTLIGGAGGGTLVGEGLGDTLVGGSGATTLLSYGTFGRTLLAGTGPTVALYEEDQLVINLASGQATSEARSIADALVGITAVEETGTLSVLIAGAGADTLLSSSVSDSPGTRYLSENTLIGGAGADVLISSGAVDTLIAGSGANTLISNASIQDVLEAGTGHDTLITSGAEDTLIGTANGSVLEITAAGAGDVAQYAGSSLTINLTAGTAAVNGQSVHDTLIGVNIAAAYGISDTLIGGTGPTTLASDGAGNTLIAGTGQATAYYSGSSIAVNLQTGRAGSDTLIGIGSAIVAGSNDTVIGGSGSNTLVSFGYYGSLIGGAGSETLMSGGQYNTLTAGSGLDTLISEGWGDTLVAARSGDFYELGPVVGPARIVNGSATQTSASNELDFTGDSDQQLWFARSGNDLQIDLMTNEASVVTISGWFASTGNQLAEITAGGLKLDSGIAQLVQAMATYSANNPGFNPTMVTQVPNDPTLQSAIASAWHQ
jgi:Ca2+-binding RTX toxin-like protein